MFFLLYINPSFEFHGGHTKRERERDESLTIGYRE